MFFKIAKNTGPQASRSVSAISDSEADGKPQLGVISGVGKGIIASSTGLLLKTTGLTVTSIKIDPYINIDAGTMAPTESVPAFRHSLSHILIDPDTARSM